VTNLIRVNFPVVVLVAMSLIVGLLMVVVFRYTSDQKTIRTAKDKLKGHMLAVRLFQDQLSVVLKAYLGILGGTCRYLRLAFKPLLFVIIPLTLLIVQMDRYLGFTPLRTGQAFLLTVRTANADLLNDVSLQLPDGLATTAAAVHIPSDNEVVWRVVAEKGGQFDVNVAAAGQTFSKHAVVSSELVRLSPIRLRGHFLERMFVSDEPALPDASPIQAIEVNYPARSISFAWLEWNWIWLFLVLSLAAGFFFKSVLRIEI
jgi:hypothetical protein